MAIIKRYFQGNKTENDAYVGPPGKFSIDTESRNVRIHDGVKPGGYEIAEIRDIEEAIRFIEYTSIQAGNIHGQDVSYQINGTYGWRDLTSEITVRGVGPNDPSWTPFINGIHAYAFSPGRLTECWVSFHIGHDYALGTKIYPHIHWTPTTNASGTLRWGFEYTVAKGHGQGPVSVFPATTTVYAEHTVSNQEYMHVTTEVMEANAIPAEYLEPDSVILMRVFRDSQDDTYPNDAFLLSASLHYQVSRMSTRNKTPDFFD